MDEICCKFFYLKFIDLILRLTSNQVQSFFLIYWLYRRENSDDGVVINNNGFLEVKVI